MTDAQIWTLIEEWTNLLDDDTPLHEYVGMTWDEFEKWKNKP